MTGTETGRSATVVAIATTMLLLVLALAHSFDAASAEGSPRRKVFLIGVVLPRRASPGSRISGSLVANPDDLAQDPRLIVKRLKVSLPVDAAGKPVLEDVFVDTGYGRQPALTGFTATVPADGSQLLVACGSGGAVERASRLDFLVQPPTATAKAIPQGYSMLPIESDSGVMAINGPYDGDKSNTRVTVNGWPAAVLAESSDAAYFAVGKRAHPGRNSAVLAQGERAIYFDMVEPQVTITADRTTLKEGESASFKVSVELQGMPANAWRAGNPSDAYDTAGAVEHARNFTPPAAGAEGVIMLTIKNQSMDTVTMSPADTYSIPLTRVELDHGPKIVEGEVTAHQAGPFDLDASLVPLLAESPGVEQPRGEIARTDHTPTPGGKETPLENRDHGTPEEGIRVAPVVPLVVARPKCCVFASITITNNFSEPVFYILNVPYVGGMSPPADQWVQPGQSRTFKGDFGECVRIKAIQNEGYDKKGNPITGLFDDEPVCCSRKNKALRFSYTINSVERREGNNCPQNGGVVPPPPLVPKPSRTPTSTGTPTATPTQTSTPTPTATPTPGPGPEASVTPVIVAPPPPAQVDCPQRHDGCAALIVDFMRHIGGTFRFPDLDEIGNELHEIGCEVDEIAPAFVDVPKLKEHDPENDAKIAAADRHNNDEWAKVFAAEDSHQDRLRAGKEVAIELIGYHGDPSTRYLPCGDWTESSEIGLESRQFFHERNYFAADHHVCDWFVADLSCFSGLTPRAIDELENFATATCTKAPKINCPLHAAWESDIATGTSIDTTKVCYDTDTRATSRKLRRLIEGQIPLNSRAKGYASLAQALKTFATGENSYYTDRGYAKDVPPQHERKGYQGQHTGD